MTDEPTEDPRPYEDAIRAPDRQLDALRSLRVALVNGLRAVNEVIERHDMADMEAEDREP